MTHRSTRRSLAGLASVVVLIAAAACTNAAVDKAAGNTEGPSDILVEQTSTGIHVENRAGRPVLNVRITVGDGKAAFVHVLPTLDTGADQTVPFDRFVNDDGEPLTAASATGALRLTARDTLGNTYGTTVP